VPGKGSGRVSAAGLACYRTRMYTGRRGERRSMSEADYAELATAAHQQLHAPVILCQSHVGLTGLPMSVSARLMTAEASAARNLLIQPAKHANRG
jgi:hypothetical protein